MDKYKLVINNREIKDYDPSEFAVLATWQTKQIDDLNKFGVFYTKTNTLPVTRDINAALKSPLVLDVYSKQSTKPTIDFFVNGEPLFTGYLKIKTGSINKIGGSIDFQIEPREKDWWDAFKDFTMQEVDLSAEDHALEENSIYFSNHVRVSWAYNVDYFPVDVGWIGERSIIGMKQDISALPTVTTVVMWTGDSIVSPGPQTVEIVGCEDSSANGTFDLTLISTAYWVGTNIRAATTTDIPLLDFPHKQHGFFLYAKDDKWLIHDFIPSAPLDLLIEKAFSQVGYSIQNSWVADNLSQTYHYEHNTEVWSKNFDSRLRFVVGMPEGGFALTGTVGTTVMPFVIRDAPGLLNNANYNDTGSDDAPTIAAKTHTSQWVAPENCYMSFVARIRCFAQASAFRIVVRDGGGTLVYTIDSKAAAAHEQNFYLSGVAYVQTGYSVSVDMLLTGLTYTPFMLEDATFEGRQIPKIIEGMEIHAADFQTDKTAYQFIKDISLLHNLQFITDPILKKVVIIPDESKLTEKVNDFTKKLDRNSEVEITEISTLHPLKYRMDYLVDSNDYEMEKRELISGRVGGGDIDNVDPFAKDTTDIVLEVYAATINGAGNFYDFIDMGIPIMKGENGERLNYVSRLLEVEYDSTTLTQYIEGTSSNIFWYFESQLATAINRATFPTTLHFSSLITTYYARFLRMLLYGYLLDGAFNISLKDAVIFNRGEDNGFRHRYAIEVDGVEIEAELYKVQDFEPFGINYTKCQFIWLKI